MSGEFPGASQAEPSADFAKAPFSDVESDESIGGSAPNPVLDDASRSVYYCSMKRIKIYLQHPFDVTVRQSLQTHERGAMVCAVPDYPEPGMSFYYTIDGINANILNHYAPNAPALFDENGTLRIPQCFYTTANAWPYQPKLRDSRPFKYALKWIRHCFSSTLDKTHWCDLSAQLDELCACLAAFKLLGMRSQVRQIEWLVKRMLRYRPLTMNEVRAVWNYHMHAHAFIEDIKIDLGFNDNEIVAMYVRNLRDITSLQYRANVGYDVERTEYAAFLNIEQVLCNELIHNPHLTTLHTWVAILERNATKSNKRHRILLWVEEMHFRTAVGVTGGWAMGGLDAEPASFDWYVEAITNDVTIGNASQDNGQTEDIDMVDTFRYD